VFDRSFILRVVSVKSDPLGSTGMPSVTFDLPLDRLNKNDIVGEVSLRFYWGV
jgi:hypothetical protein